MKATATCTCATCGRTFEKTWEIRKSSERESTIAYMTKRYTECGECWKARTEAKRAESDKAAGLAEITVGSDKQIAWAKKIRDEKIEKVLRLVRPEMKERVVEIIAEVSREHDDARWWIDTRDDENKALLDAIMAKWQD